MGKNFKFVALAAVIFYLPAFFITKAHGEEKITVDKAYMEGLERRIAALEAGQKSSIDPNEYLTEDVRDLMETMEEVEKKTLMDRLTWGAEFRNRVNWLQYQDKSTGENLHTDELYQARLRLNFFADVTDNLKFSGRLTGYWNWGDIMGQSDSTGWGPYNRATIPTDTTIRIERAYIDYFFDSIPFCLTVGRQPSAGGPPGELRENRVRKSTWPMLFIDQEQDVAVGTINTSTFLPLEQSNLRIYYFKYHALDSGSTDYKHSGIQNAVNAYGFQFETLVPQMGDTLLAGGFGVIKDYTLSRDPSSFDISSSLGAAKGTYLPTVYPKDLGEVFQSHVLLFSQNLYNSGLDLFAEWVRHDYRPNGKTVQYAVPGIAFGLMSDDGATKHAGNAVHSGFRYTVPFPLMNDPKFGFEYVHGDRHWKAFSDGHDDTLDLMGVRGNTYDVYYIQPINQYLFCRFGATFINHDFSSGNSIYGEPKPVDEKVRNFYGLVEMRF
jgi:hypothetical protein